MAAYVFHRLKISRRAAILARFFLGYHALNIECTAAPVALNLETANCHRKMHFFVKLADRKVFHEITTRRLYERAMCTTTKLILQAKGS